MSENEKILIALLDINYTKLKLEHVNSSLMTIQSILVGKGIVSVEEIRNAYEEFLQTESVSENIDATRKNIEEIEAIVRKKG